MSLQRPIVVETRAHISDHDSRSPDPPYGKSRDAVMNAPALGAHLLQAPGRGSLTARERRVLLEISRGASNKQVARLLDISPSTVRTHVESIFRKLQCSTRTAATVKALALGVIA